MPKVQKVNWSAMKWNLNLLLTLLWPLQIIPYVNPLESCIIRDYEAWFKVLSINRAEQMGHCSCNYKRELGLGLENNSININWFYTQLGRLRYRYGILLLNRLERVHDLLTRIIFSLPRKLNWIVYGCWL